MSAGRSWTRRATHFAAEHRILILACLLALAVRLAFFLAIKPWDGPALERALLTSQNDSAGYLRLARDIADSGTYPADNAYRTPGYPLMVALVFLLFRGSLAAVLLVQILMDVALVIVTYLLARETFESRTVGHIAAFLYAVSLMSAFFSTKLMTEIPFTLFFAAGLLVFIRALKQQDITRCALAGFIIGLAALIRPVVQFFPLVLAAAGLGRWRRIGPKRAVLGAVVLLAAYGATISPWQIRNYRLFGHYALSCITGINLYFYNVGITKANAEGMSLREVQEQLAEQVPATLGNPFEQGNLWKREAMKYIRAHPGRYIRYHLKGTANMFMGTAKGSILVTFRPGWVPWKEERPLSEGLPARIRRMLREARGEYFLSPVLAAKDLIEYLFVVVGCVVVFRSRQKRLYTSILILAVLYFVAITGIVGTGRYKIPVIPLYLAVSANGMFEAFRFWKARKGKAARDESPG